MSTHSHVHSRRALFLISFVFTLIAVAVLSQPCAAQEEKGFGLVAGHDAAAKDVGLPLYPGSRPHKDSDKDETNAANLGLWSGGSGFKLFLVKMESDDTADKVAEFYRKALAKYGKVLDCSNPPAKGETAKGDSSLTCDEHQPQKGTFVFKVGNKEHQRAVNIEAKNGKVEYQLLYVKHWGNKQD